MVLFNPQPATRHITSGSKFRVLSTGINVVMPKSTEEISLSGWVCSVFANLTFILHTVLDKSNAFPRSRKTLSAAMKGSDYRSVDCREISTRPQPGDFATTRGSNCYHLVAAIFPSRGRNYAITRSPQTNPQRVHCGHLMQANHLPRGRTKSPVRGGSGGRFPKFPKFPRKSSYCTTNC